MNEALKHVNYPALDQESSPGVRRYYRLLQLDNYFRRVNLTGEQKQELADTLTQEYLQEDPAIALYALFKEQPELFSCEPEPQKPVTHLLLTGICGDPKLKDLNTYLGEAEADSFHDELREEMARIIANNTNVRDSNYIAKLNKGVVMHLSLDGGDLSKVCIQARLNDTLKICQEKGRQIFKAHLQIAKTKYERQLELYPEDKAIRTKLLYIDTKLSEIEAGNGFGFLAGVNTFDLKDEDQSDLFTKCQAITAGSTIAAKQVAMRKKKFDNNTITGAYEFVTNDTGAYEQVGSTHTSAHDQNGGIEKSYVQVYDPVYVASDIFRARASLIKAIYDEIEECEPNDIGKVWARWMRIFTLDNNGDIILRPEMAQIIRKIDSFRQSAAYQKIIKDDPEFEYKISLPWFDAIQIIDYITKVQRENFGDYQERVDQVLALRKRVLDSGPDEVDSEAFEELYDRLCVSHKSEPGENVLTRLGRMNARLNPTTKIGNNTDGKNIGGLNNAEYSLQVIKIMKVFIDLVQEDLPRRKNEYLELCPEIEKRDEGSSVKLRANLNKICTYFEEGRDFKSQIEPSIIRLLFNHHAFLQVWYQWRVNSQHEQAVSEIILTGCDETTRYFKQSLTEVYEDRFNLGDEQGGDESYGEGELSFEDAGFFGDELFAVIFNLFSEEEFSQEFASLVAEAHTAEDERFIAIGQTIWEDLHNRIYRVEEDNAPTLDVIGKDKIRRVARVLYTPPLITSDYYLNLAKSVVYNFRTQKLRPVSVDAQGEGGSIIIENINEELGLCYQSLEVRREIELRLDETNHKIRAALYVYDTDLEALAARSDESRYRLAQAFARMDQAAERHHTMLKYRDQLAKMPLNPEEDDANIVGIIYFSETYKELFGEYPEEYLQKAS